MNFPSLRPFFLFSATSLTNTVLSTLYPSTLARALEVKIARVSRPYRMGVGGGAVLPYVVPPRHGYPSAAQLCQSPLVQSCRKSMSKCPGPIALFPHASLSFLPSFLLVFSFRSSFRSLFVLSLSGCCAFDCFGWAFRDGHVVMGSEGVGMKQGQGRDRDMSINMDVNMDRDVDMSTSTSTSMNTNMNMDINLNTNMDIDVDMAVAMTMHNSSTLRDTLIPHVQVRRVIRTVQALASHPQMPPQVHAAPTRADWRSNGNGRGTKGTDRRKREEKIGTDGGEQRIKYGEKMESVPRNAMSHAYRFYHKGGGGEGSATETGQ